DFYSAFDEDEIIINPNEIKLIPTGIATAFDKGFALILKERSSTGSKGMAVRMGVIDSGYRGEIFIGINNTNSKPIVITKNTNIVDDTYIVHDYNKAIAQALLIDLPAIEVIEISYADLL